MLEYSLLLLYTLIGWGNGILQKEWQRKTEKIKYSSAVYLIAQTACSCLVFFVMAGFDLRADAVTLIYSFVYALIVILSLVSNFVAMSKMNLMLCSVFNNGSQTVVWLVGIVFFRDVFEFGGALSAGLILISVLLPLLKLKGNKTAKGGIAVGFFRTAVSASSIVLVKLYAAEPHKMSDSVMCFYTNLFILVLLLIYFVFMKDKSGLIDGFSNVGKKIVFAPICAVLSNLGTVLSMYVLRTLPLSTYSIVTYSLGFATVFINSKFIFREKRTAIDTVAFILSAIAVVITIF